MLKFIKLWLNQVSALTSLIFLASPTHSQTIHSTNTPYTIYDFLTGSDQVKGKMIALKASIKCRSVDLCWIDTSEGLSIAINTNLITSYQKHRLVEECYYRACNQLLIGKSICSHFELYGIDKILPVPMISESSNDSLYYGITYEDYVKEKESSQ